MSATPGIYFDVSETPTNRSLSFITIQKTSSRAVCTCSSHEEHPDVLARQQRRSGLRPLRTRQTAPFHVHLYTLRRSLFHYIFDCFPNKIGRLRRHNVVRPYHVRGAVIGWTAESVLKLFGRQRVGGIGDSQLVFLSFWLAIVLRRLFDLVR